MESFKLLSMRDSGYAYDKIMSLMAKILYHGFKLTGLKKMFALPQEEFIKKVNQINEKRGFFIPKDHKFHYEEQVILEKYSCLVIRQNEKPSKKAILFFFGGGMVIGPDQGDVSYAGKICKATGCDVWFPFYPLCTEHCITETYAMAYECYKKMIEIYGGGNISTSGLSSGGALALGIAAHNNAQSNPLPAPDHIVVSSPGECPHNDAERKRMQELSPRDVCVDYKFMFYEDHYMRHGNENVPEYMLSGSLGDYSGVHDIHFFYSEDEVLYAAAPYFEEACKRSNVSYTMSVRKGMVHCYVMAPFFREAKEDFRRMIDFLK